jgi:GNAT superfamily N-acetyltransferase
MLVRRSAAIDRSVLVLEKFRPLRQNSNNVLFCLEVMCLMKSKHIPMSSEEFQLMEHPFGWKAEYFSGKAHLTPREHLVRTHLTLAPQAVAVSDRIVPVDPSLQELMIAMFFEAFQDSVEFCDWSVDDIHTHAAKNINNYFQGVRGKPHPVSKMAVEPDSQQIIGLALFVENKEQRFELDLLFVKPSHQRKGIATQMVASAINNLYADGIEDLRCGYHICNEGSRAWQHSLGFQEIPDYFYCRLKAAWYRDEIWRREELGASEQLEELRTERDRWERLGQELEPWKES